MSEQVMALEQRTQRRRTIAACQVMIHRPVGMDTCGHSRTSHDEDGCFTCRTAGYVGWVHAHTGALDVVA